MNPDADVRVRVATPAAAGAAYDVIIQPGVLQRAADSIVGAVDAATYCIIAPDDVAPLYAEPLLKALGRDASLLTFAADEAHKTRETWSTLTDAMLARELGRDTCIIAVGGGVAGDVAGFVAATYMRGVPVVQIPTTLLAMIDASVGGKTGVDTPAGKNLIGAFHPPQLVLIDPLVLRTLSSDQLRSGLAEAVKHGAIADIAYFERLEREAEALLALDEAALAWLIRGSVEIKAHVVAEDPYERGLRAILNFGHTVAHALEAHEQYAMLHGFAVAAGMVAEAALGEAIGVSEPGTAARLRSLLEVLGMPSRIAASPEALLPYMRVDKKARAAAPRFALLRHIGAAAQADDGRWTHAVPEAVIAGVLQSASRGADVV